VSPEDVQALLEQAEGPRLAFARERARPDDLAETLVAFANAHGGHLLLGVGGRSRARIEGLRDPVAARDLLIEAALACTPPLILPLPVEVALGAASLMLVEVPAGLSQVYSLHGKYVRREGATNQPLAPDALRRLLLERGDVSWERSAATDARHEDLDPLKIRSYLARLGTPEADPDRLLLRRGCLLHDPRPPQELRPTNAGMLLFAADVRARLPQAELTLVQYHGPDLADEFERDDICDTLVEALRRAERWLIEHMRRGSRMVGLERQDWSQFPPAAVREVLVNAVAHRDYSIRGEGIRIALFSDRLEVYSPGRLPGHVTVENIVAERFSRNETLVQVLADYGLIERLGYGIDRMIGQMQAAGLPPPEFRETAAGFLVTLQGHPTSVAAAAGAAGIDIQEWERQGLNERQIAALVHLTEQRRISNRDLQELQPDVSAETLRRDLSDLVERGLLIKIGDKRATYYILK
jgi:ATP-dependent DNA helicase RecG